MSTWAIKGRMHFGGMPVEPDVRVLFERFGVPRLGTTIAHEDVEAALELKRQTRRYRTVTTKWRHRLEEDHNIVMIWIGEGFRACTPPERLDFAEEQRHRGVRRLGRAVKVAAGTPTALLDDKTLQRRDHFTRTTTIALAAVKKSIRDYTRALREGPERLPKPKPPE